MQTVSGKYVGLVWDHNTPLLSTDLDDGQFVVLVPRDLNYHLNYHPAGPRRSPSDSRTDHTSEIFHRICERVGPGIWKGLEPENSLMPPMSLFEIAIVSAIVGVLVLWFGIYLWRERRDR
jgi:hypothetical protein